MQKTAITCKMIIKFKSDITSVVQNLIVALTEANLIANEQANFLIDFYIVIFFKHIRTNNKTTSRF